MPLPNTTLQTRIDNLLENVRTTVVTRQNAYLTRRGRYWQGRVTHAQPPVDPNPSDDFRDVPPKVGVATDRPTDQEEPWGPVQTSDGFTWPGFALPARLPISLQVDVYASPSGPGYTVTATVELSAALWRRRWNVGPEAYRAQVWQRS